jgi:hypothetical protein
MGAGYTKGRQTSMCQAVILGFEGNTSQKNTGRKSSTPARGHPGNKKAEICISAEKTGGDLLSRNL